METMLSACRFWAGYQLFDGDRYVGKLVLVHSGVFNGWNPKRIRTVRVVSFYEDSKVDVERFANEILNRIGDWKN